MTQAVSATERTISVRAGMFSVRYVCKGAGRPLVFLHDVLGLQPEAPYLDALARRFTVYALWQPGWGDSTGLNHIDDIHDLVTFYQDLFDTLELDKPLLVGHSFGGLVAAELASHCVCTASKLVLASPLGIWREGDPIPDLFTMTAEETAQVVWQDPAGDLARRFSAQPTDPVLQADAMIERGKALAAAGKFLWPFPDTGLEKRLHRIKAPTLLVWGDSDRLVPPAYAEEFRSHIPNASVVTLKGAGHMAPIERCDEFVAAVEAFAGGA